MEIAVTFSMMFITSAVATDTKAVCKYLYVFICSFISVNAAATTVLTKLVQFYLFVSSVTLMLSSG